MHITVVRRLAPLAAIALVIVSGVVGTFVAASTAPPAQSRRALSSADIDDIATLLKLEDTRQFDEAALARILKSPHPEVRRRAAVSVGRIADPRGGALLNGVRADADLEVAASAVFAMGQLRDPALVPWLGETLSASATNPVIAREAAQALGKIRSPEARVALGQYLTTAPATAAAAPVVGEALLSLGRFTGKGDLAPITRWSTSSNVEIRWRAAWALFRLRDAEALPHLIKLADDPSGDVRFWAVRGFAPATVDAAKMDRAAAAARLRAAVLKDPDRRVRTEALRVLVQYDDETAFGVLVNALYSPDTWLSVSAAEAAGRFTSRANVLAPVLVDVADDKAPIALRMTILPALVTMAPQATKTMDLAAALVRSDVVAAQNAGIQALGRLGDPGLAKLDELISDPALAARLTQLQAARARAGAAGAAGARAGGAAGGGAAGGARAGGAAGAAGGRGAKAPRQARPDAEYRALVEKWIVPDYNGAPKPRAIWETPKGLIELELFPGDSPFGVEHFFRVVQSGDIVGTEFTRLVPNFVAQQQAIRNASTLRDEVNRHGLTRGNLAWASAGLDTGRPGYTLGHTPQPHNEGDFTSLGRVVAGMDVVDKLELGDRIVSAKIK